MGKHRQGRIELADYDGGGPPSLNGDGRGLPERPPWESALLIVVVFLAFLGLMYVGDIAMAYVVHGIGGDHGGS